MTYASKWLAAFGTPCTVLPSGKVSSLSMKQLSRRPTVYSEPFWEGLIPSDSGLQSGDFIQVGQDYYLVLSVRADYSSGELAWLGLKTNAVLSHKRAEQSVDQNGNIIESWTTISDTLRAFGEIVTAQMRQTDPGLLEATRYYFYAPKSSGVRVLDRIVYAGENYAVVAADDIAFSGVLRLQAGADQRP